MAEHLISRAQHFRKQGSLSLFPPRSPWLSQSLRPCRNQLWTHHSETENLWLSPSLETQTSEGGDPNPFRAQI